MRHSRKRRIYPRGRPHNEHRLRTRVGYLRRVSLMIKLFFATAPLLAYAQWANGIPNRRSSSRASSSVFAVVTTVTSIPRTLSIES